MFHSPSKEQQREDEDVADEVDEAVVKVASEAVVGAVAMVPGAVAMVPGVEEAAEELAEDRDSPD